MNKQDMFSPYQTLTNMCGFEVAESLTLRENPALKHELMAYLQKSPQGCR